MPHWLECWLWRQRSTRLASPPLIGAAAGVLTAVFWQLGRMRRPSAGTPWRCVYTTTVWLGIWPMSAEATARRVTREDPSRATSDVLTLFAAVASLAAVGIVLVRAHDAHGATRSCWRPSGADIAVSWLTVHTVFTLRYALMYYTEPVGGIDFNGRTSPPTYRTSRIWRSRSG